MKFWSSGDGTGSRVKKKLKTIDLSCRKIEEKRVTVINFGMNERCGDSRSCSAIHSTANTTKVANIEKAGFGDTRDVFSKRKIFINDDTKVTSRINRSESDIVWKMNCRRAELRELLRKTNDEKFSFGRIECEKICRHPVGNI